MSAFRSDWPKSPAFHPEFGLLCPSSRARRGLRVTAVAVALGAAVSATMGLAVAHWRDAGAAAGVSAVAEEAPLAVDLRGPLAGAAPAGPARGHDCKAAAENDLDASFLNPTCGVTKPHARHGAHVPSRVSTFILGRTDVAREGAPEAPAVVATDPSAKIAASTASSSDRPEPPVKKPKAKPRAPTAIVAQDGAQQDTMISAYAPTPRFGGTSSGPNSPGFRALPPGFASPFGRTW